tara:strand:- start:110 stop:382 length:273 start_codon:yes stop_codon:yes gene_type:complete
MFDIYHRYVGLVVDKNDHLAGKGVKKWSGLRRTGFGFLSESHSSACIFSATEATEATEAMVAMVVKINRMRAHGMKAKTINLIRIDTNGH